LKTRDRRSRSFPPRVLRKASPPLEGGSGGVERGGHDYKAVAQQKTPSRAPRNSPIRPAFHQTRAWGGEWRHPPVIRRPRQEQAGAHGLDERCQPPLTNRRSQHFPQRAFLYNVLGPSRSEESGSLSTPQLFQCWGSDHSNLFSNLPPMSASVLRRAWISTYGERRIPPLSAICRQCPPHWLQIGYMASSREARTSIAAGPAPRSSTWPLPPAYAAPWRACAPRADRFHGEQTGRVVASCGASTLRPATTPPILDASTRRSRGVFVS
jgi:hypothetical protein